MILPIRLTIILRFQLKLFKTELILQTMTLNEMMLVEIQIWSTQMF